MDKSTHGAINPATPESRRSTKEGPGIRGSNALPASTSSPVLWITVLSLDAPAVAVLWQLLFARSFHIRLDASITVLLALVVWLIYVADRVLDTLKVPAADAEASRHVFYRRHPWAFSLPCVAAFLLAVWISLTYLDSRTFRYGIVILLAVGVYLLVVHLLPPGHEWLPKEMLVGVLFAAGTCFPVWEHMTQDFEMFLASYLLFTALCWMNCVAIEYEEWVRVRRHQAGSPHPWTVWMGQRFIPLTFTIAIFIAALLLFGPGRPSWLLLAAELLSALAFALIRYKDQSLSTDQFRFLMDLALFTPVFFLPFS